MSQTYKDLLTTLAEKIGHDAASLIATDQVIIDGLSISIQLVNEGEHAEVVLCTLLGNVPSERWAEVTRALLRANHLWIGTDGGALGLLGDDDMASLSVRRPLRELNADNLADLLVRTTDFGLAWQDFIAQGTPSDSSEKLIFKKMAPPQKAADEKKFIH